MMPVFYLGLSESIFFFKINCLLDPEQNCKIQQSSVAELEVPIQGRISSLSYTDTANLRENV